MAAHTKCNICEHPQSFDEAKDTSRVPCNVRAFKGEVFTFWRCQPCGSIHCLEDADLDHYYAKYPIKVHALDFWTRAAYANLTHQLQKAGITDNMSILDYGAGPGLLVKYLISQGYKKTVGYDAHVLGYNDKHILEQTYDCIVAQDVIEHMEDPRDFLAGMVKCVKPGGIISIGTPNAEKVDLSKPDTYALSLHPPYHRHLLSETALVNIAQGLGLVPIRRYHRFYYDTIIPTVNYRFLREYVRRIDNTHDAAFEPARIGVVLKSPILWFYALFGYFFPPRSEMIIIFKKQ